MRTYSWWLAVILIFASCVEAPRSGRLTLRVGGLDYPESFDPHKRNSLGSHNVIFQMYEPLVFRDREMKLHPGLVISWENPADNLWRFRLRSLPSEKEFRK